MLDLYVIQLSFKLILLCRFKKGFAFIKTTLLTLLSVTLFYIFFYVLLTVHLSLTLVNDQLDAQFFYFIIRSLQSSTCFEQRRAHHQEVKFY